MLAALGGCTPRAVIDVRQPHAAATQKHIRLTSFWAYFDESPPVERVLLAFPLPGAWAGKQEYCLYLRLLDKKGTCKIGEAIGERRVCGFFLQKSGRLAGLAEFAAGKIVTKGLAFDGGKMRDGRVDLQCIDGTKIAGQFIAELAPLELRDFEEYLHAADVQALLRRAGATAQTTTRPDGK